jgi:hypothetical protein
MGYEQLYYAYGYWHNSSMNLKYQTGVATLAQFIVMSALNFINSVAGDVQSCTSDGGCLGDVVLNLLYFLLVAVWFGFIWVLGYTAQDRRSKRIAQVLILAEAAIALVALQDTRGNIAHTHHDILGFFTSVIDLGFAIWVITLAWRLMRAGGGRVTTARSRQRKV